MFLKEKRLRPPGKECEPFKSVLAFQILSNLRILVDFVEKKKEEIKKKKNHNLGGERTPATSQMLVGFSWC